MNEVILQILSSLCITYHVIYYMVIKYYMVTNRQKQLQGFQQVNINNTRQFNQV